MRGLAVVLLAILATLWAFGALSLAIAGLYWIALVPFLFALATVLLIRRLRRRSTRN
jgi:hypothetical protein